MKKILAVLLMVSISLSMCMPAFAASPKEKQAATDKHEKEVKEYLNNLEPPKNIRITSINNKDNIYVDFNYHFTFDDEMYNIANEKDITDTNRYQIYTESIFWLDENYRQFAKSASSVYCEEGVIEEANFLCFYEGMFPECIYESDLYFFYDDCLKFKDKYGYNNYGFDMTDHFINLQVRYRVLDTLTGEVFYSNYSDPVRFGKGYTSKEDKPIKSFKDSPLPVSNVKKYIIYYNTEEPTPYFFFKFGESKEVRKAEDNNSGTPYLRIEVKNKEGKWEEVVCTPYESVNSKTYVICYLPGDAESLFKLYDYENISFRFRYEFYLNGEDPWNSKPYGTGSYSTITIK